MITKTTLQVTELSAWKHPVNAVVYTPDNVNTSGLPLILFNHGVGEKGSYPTDIDKLVSQGLPLVLSGSYKPPFDFVMIALQHNSWSPTVQWNVSMIDEAYRLYKIDKTKVLLTGLSAGGQTTYDSQFTIDIVSAKKFLAIAPLSSANGVNQGLASAFKQTLIPVWATCGATDNLEATNASYAFAINAQVPGLCTYTKIPNTGHGGWVKVYDGTIKDANGKNIWDFFTAKLGGVVLPPVVIPPVVIPPVKKLLQTVLLYDDNTYEIK